MRVKYQSLLSLFLAALMLFSLGGEAFADTLTLPAELQTIEEEAFYGDTSLDEVVIPEGTTTIGQRAFADSGLKRIDIPDTVTAIADNAFDGTEDLTVHATPRTYAAEYAKNHGIHWEHDPIACTELGLNQQVTGSITESNAYVYYSFTPESSGMYMFQSEASNREFLYMDVFDSDWNKIDSLFVDGKAELTAGETYYIVVTFTDMPMTGDFWIKVNIDAGLSATQEADGYERSDFEPPYFSTYYVSMGAQFTAEIDATVERGGLRYEWYLDGVLAEGQTSSAYTLTVERFHRITGIVYDDFGNSVDYDYCVYADTNLTAKPKDDRSRISVQPGGSATMTVNATCDLEPLTYQWYRAEPVYDNQFAGLVLYNYIKIDGATEPSYSVQDVYETSDYWCEVTDPLGNPVGVSFYMIVGTDFSVQPRNGQYSFSVNPGETVEMAVEANADTELSYQWYEEITTFNYSSNKLERKTVLIDGETESSYTISVDRQQHYFCKVSDTYGNKRYAWFYLNVETHLQAHAKDYQNLITVNPGESVKLEVEASCDAALNYQWYEQSEAYDSSAGYWSISSSKRIDGATESHIFVESADMRKKYICLVSDTYGNSQDVIFNLRVESHLEAHAKNSESTFNVVPGTAVVMTVEATCDKQPLRYQWYEQVYYMNSYGYETTSTKSIEGATDSSYSTSDTYKKKNYFCRVIDPYGNMVEVGFNLRIETHLEAHAKDGQNTLHLDYGQSVELTVEASCDDTLSYQWYERYRTLSSSGYWYTATNHIDGATDVSYTTDNINEYREYYCRVSDTCGNTQHVWFYVNVNQSSET